MLLVALLPALATARRCLGLTIEGGGARGGYSAAVVKALTDHLPNEDLQYDIITGVSAGALNTGSFATFAKG